ncbi:hypothetical protein TNCV_1058661 [Trichonephila clavipes]|nr:hypothetical protein TNCV_1058661 [Trichonephila clavipes]
MDKCVQMLDKELWHLGPVGPGVFLACYAQIGRGKPRDFCDLPKRRDEGRVVNVCLKWFFSGDRGEKEEAWRFGGCCVKAPGRDTSFFRERGCEAPPAKGLIF